MPTSLSVITATFNAAAVLPRLAQSLAAQQYREFEWIVVDGGSSDGTLAFLEEFSKLHSWCRFTSGPDFGIYDALNRGIDRMRNEHYVVAGADDQFSPAALGCYAAAVEATPGADIFLAQVKIGDRIGGGLKRGNAWLGHQRVFGGSHSVGMLIRRSLHQRFGRYSNRFPMLADGYFLKKALHSGDVAFVDCDFVAGEFALGGLSSSGKMQSLGESWQIQMLTERNRLLQMAVFLVKLALRLPVLLAQGR